MTEEFQRAPDVQRFPASVEAGKPDKAGRVSVPAEPSDRINLPGPKQTLVTAHEARELRSVLNSNNPERFRLVAARLDGEEKFPVPVVRSGQPTERGALGNDLGEHARPFGAVALCVVLLVLIGCGSQRAMRPGRAEISPGRASVVQPENPATPTTTLTERETTTESFPAVHGFRTGSLSTVPAPSAVSNVTRQVERTVVTIGGAHRDEARGLSAKFSAIRPVQYAGLALILGAGALAYFQWWTKAALVGLCGLGMVVVAAVIPGNELLILGGFAAVAVIGCLLVLYAYKSGKLDRDGDGIPDFLQPKK